MRYFPTIFVFISVMACSQFAFSNEQDNLGEFLHQLQHHPFEALQSELERTPEAASVKKFHSKDIASKDFILLKDSFRKKATSFSQENLEKANLLDHSPALRSLIRPNDRPISLIGVNPETNLLSLEQQGLASGSVARIPWSDDYWPYYSGAIGKRYADRNWPKTDHSQWIDYYNYINVHSFHNRSYVLQNLDDLSPSEKYDILLFGINGGFPLTRSMWSHGKYYWEKHGQVEKWFGLCHGWATAAVLWERPRQMITVKAIDGTILNFYPSDLKALASLLWSKLPPAPKAIGGRCPVKNPERDSKGRIIDPNCHDTNPGTFHQVLAHLVGLKKKSFVMDSTFDYEVWNQPVANYQYSYFNPMTGERANSLLSNGGPNHQLLVKLSDWPNDPFIFYRDHSKAKYIVGVELKLGYVVEVPPYQRPMDHERYDGVIKVTYRYDLELDENFNIVGGEWYTDKHPDFLWLHPEGTRALSPYEKGLSGSWNPTQSLPVPQAWIRSAHQGALQGHPLEIIVRALFEAASK